MILVERHIIKCNSLEYNELDNLCFLSKNLYNTALYRIRQHYLDTGKYLNKFQLINELTKEHQVDYIALPRKVSQQVIYQVDQNMQSFFKLLKLKNSGKYERNVSLPYYKEKDGRNLLIFTNQAISKKQLETIKIIKFGKNIQTTISTKQELVQQVRVVPHGHDYIAVEVLYNKQEPLLKTDNKRYMSIDLGINNLCTIGSKCTDVKDNIIINGKPVKSINQYYNKKYAKYKSIQSKTKSKIAYTNKLRTLRIKRENKLNDYLHKTSRYIVNHLVSNNINTLIIGYNKEWKQETNIGKVNNQKFIQIPYLKLVNQLQYKCKLEGINVIIQEESYTSKSSFLDNDFIPTFKSTTELNYKFSGIRIKRGLYKSLKGRLINADLNGSLNILRKAVPNAFDKCYGIEVCSTPKVITL